ncbi:MAG: 30S ribosomal protein S19e [Candidatus Micrarchaeia archaeon]|jgi:small subunit ribosomal protein S19e
MVTVFDVQPGKLIDKAAEELEKMGIEKPDFINYVKSGSHAERRPEQQNFWFIRLASLLRQAYTNPKIGVNRLRTHYGGKKNRGRKPSKHRDSSGSIIRRGLQELEKQGFIKKEKVGRVITGKGKKFLDNIAKQVAEGQ